MMDPRQGFASGTSATDDPPFLISIVTVNYNGCPTLPTLLDGVGALLDAHPCFEHVIIDGASRDGSVELFERYVAAHRNAVLVSERDKGIYDAMNKGVRRSRGRWFIHLNSDDQVTHPQRWQEVADLLLSRAPRMLTTPVPIMRGTLELRVLPGQPVSMLHRRFGYHFPHQGTFFERDLFELVGGYNIHIGYIADKIFSYQLLDRIDDSQICHRPGSLALQQVGGISSNSRLTPLKTLWLAIRSARLAPHRHPYLRAVMNLAFKICLAHGRKMQ